MRCRITTRLAKDAVVCCLLSYVGCYLFITRIILPYIDTINSQASYVLVKTLPGNSLVAVHEVGRVSECRPPSNMQTTQTAAVGEMVVGRNRHCLCVIKSSKDSWRFDQLIH